MGRESHIASVKCLRVESNFDEEKYVFGERFQLKYFKYRIKRQFQDLLGMQMVGFMLEY